MKKLKLPIWLVCLLFIAATLLINLRYWRPITADSGRHFTLTLEDASHGGSTLYLEFEGISDDFRMPWSEAYAPLLKPSALEKEYEVIAKHKPGGRRGRSYYDVYALESADGTVYLSIEQSEAIRQGLLPKRLGLTLALDALACVLIIFRMKHDRSKEVQSA